ncbi:DUF5984 family protein [Listeria monocytogenes]|uniref:DUF5984 family protein n=1 Tax=Listeria monocytogenes TaxID=1639 RepID=UPI0012493DCD|nr:DUF5984 family protein [Listeria monocytogenes]EAG3548937.1 hypothetical protein [Listeria monocytogenes]EAV9824602.1 hypothetical protein [Listeria monocytogenes]MPR50907.1 hypothetical protein [Listeria monocytogenes]MPR53136.1 hypothetical protein [Listeria monocytogenes]MPR56784.1 hypothetical protein [Listeria monocytogenes]
MKKDNLSSISIDYKFNTDKELGEGDLEFYINGKNLCSYKKDGNLKSYSWNLFCVVTWMCENIEYIIGYDPFPLPVKGDTSLELISEADQYESEDIIEEYLWNSAKSTWIFKHNWFSYREGSILPQVYFRRVGNDIEICWDNDFWQESGIEFQMTKGSVRIEKDNFVKTITEFIRSFLTKASELTNDEEQQIKIENLSRQLQLIEE